MKRKTLLLFLSFSIIFSANVSAQIINRDSTNFSQNKFDEQINHYQQKSKNQKTVAWILLGGGMLLNVVGSSLEDNNFSANTSGYEIISQIGGLATLGSIPFFFSSSKNNNKAHLADFQKSFAISTSDSLRKITVEDASDYFLTRSRNNNTTGIVLSAIGGGFIVAGIVDGSSYRRDNYIFGNLNQILLILSGVTFGALSIPFYVRGGHLKRTANVILKTERIPKPELSSSSFSPGGQFVALGIKIHL